MVAGLVEAKIVNYIRSSAGLFNAVALVILMKLRA
jgi:hypothetical protein